MLKTLRNLFKQDKEKFVVPKSVQSVIPIKTIWADGIFLVGSNKYAKTFKFEDINYTVAIREDKEAMFLEYSELLNALDSVRPRKSQSITAGSTKRILSRPFLFLCPMTVWISTARNTTRCCLIRQRGLILLCRTNM